MTPRSLAVTVEPLAFREPLRIAGRIITGLPGVRVTIRQGAVAGRGEAGGVFYLADGPEHMTAEIERVRGDIERGADREVLLELLPPGGARNALDAALWELDARLSGQPVWRLAGLRKPQPVVTTYTLGADAPDDLRRRLAAYGDAKALKLKLDGDLDADRERIRMIHAARPDAWLMVDGNEGYTRDGLLALAPDLSKGGVRLLEQPLPRGREHDLEGLDLPVPLAADESLQGPADLAGLVGRFQVANIKLDKCGGLTAALRMAAEARRLGLGVMVGNMGGSSLAAAPAWLLAQVCDHVDLDGPKFLAEDLAGGAHYARGKVEIPSGFWGE